jgi:hypothetical protein
MLFLFRGLCSLILLPLPLLLRALNLPHRLVAVADALLGMVNIVYPPLHNRNQMHDTHQLRIITEKAMRHDQEYCMLLKSEPVQPSFTLLSTPK